MGKPIRVLIAEDSPTIRHFLAGLINAAPDMTVIGEARDGQEALMLARRLKPDIISMDIQMPRLNGLDATQQLMQDYPLPIVIVSGRLYRNESVDLAFMALQAGALAVLETPPHRDHPEFAARRDRFVGTLRTMAGVSVVRRWGQTGPLPPLQETLPLTERDAQPRLIAMGASAGGPIALYRILSKLPVDFPVPIAVVQHMADGFVEGMIRWLNSGSPLHVLPAEQGQIIRPGEVVVASSGAHMLVEHDAQGVRVRLDPERGDTPYQPSVDRLFESAVAQFGGRSVGVLLTGMGEDGARGLLRMREDGARTLVQDQQSCLVYGMPGAAVELGAAEQIVPLKHIASTILDLVKVVSEE